MNKKIIEIVAFVALLLAAGFSSAAQNDGSALSSANDPLSTSTAFTIDKNIIESTPKSIFNHKEHKTNTNDIKKTTCFTAICVLCEFPLCSLW